MNHVGIYKECFWQDYQYKKNHKNEFIKALTENNSFQIFDLPFRYIVTCLRNNRNEFQSKSLH